jgi:hypothetical protein
VVPAGVWLSLITVVLLAIGHLVIAVQDSTVWETSHE